MWKKLALILAALFMVFRAPLAEAQSLSTGAPEFDVSTYRLAPNDRVKVTVYNEPTLSGDFAVNADGALAFPLVGNVPARGMSPIELQSAIEQALANGYVREPRVSVEVLTFRPFYIYGEVNAPGQYAYSPGLTVLNAVALAKGFTYRANKGRIFLKRSSEGTGEVRVGNDTMLLPGDTIRIPERFF